MLMGQKYKVPRSVILNLIKQSCGTDLMRAVSESKLIEAVHVLERIKANGLHMDEEERGPGSCYTGSASSHSSEVLMNDASGTLTGPAIPAEVQQFAAEKKVSRFLNAVIDLARQAFPSAALCVSLGEDAEDRRHQYIALDVEVSGLATQELLAGQRIWSAEIGHVCPSPDAVYFVLGWR
jgi:hypothetical protein